MYVHILNFKKTKTQSILNTLSLHNIFHDIVFKETYIDNFLAIQCIRS